MFEKIKFIFWISLILYLILVFTQPVIAVYLKYIAIPVIVVSGVIYWFTYWKDKKQQNN